MTRTCPQCGESYDTGDVRRIYCGGACQRKANARISAKKHRMNALRHCAAAFTVVTGGLSLHSPNISAAQAAWEVANVYSQQHPMGPSLHN